MATRNDKKRRRGGRAAVNATDDEGTETDNFTRKGYCKNCRKDGKSVLISEAEGQEWHMENFKHGK